jgi:outer membrane protein TolC
LRRRVSCRNHRSLARRAYLRMETEKLRRNSLTGNAPIDAIPTGGNRSSTLYEAGIQFSLPVQNRVAEANLGADKALLRQQQLRVTQLESQVAAEVQNAITALHAAENAVDAATKARELQAQLLGAAQESFSAGYSTNISVIEQQTYLTQAQSTEVFAKAARLKAADQLDRVLGKTLEKNGISLKAEKMRDGWQQH